MQVFRRPFSRGVALCLLIALFAAEFWLFDHFGSRRVTALYPRWNDQIQYLSECYTGYEYARAHGWIAGLWQSLVNPSAQGTLHDFVAIIGFAFVGPSRSAALALNMLALIAWQGALFVAVLRGSRSSGLALLAACLPLALNGPWQNVPGSAYDFRLDHLAMCALGVTTATALLSDGLRNRRGSVLFGVAAGVTLLTRFLTGTYFVLIFVVLIGWTLCQRDRTRRMANLLIAAAVAAAMAAPIFWLNREWVWNYYYMGHYVGPESAIRNQNFGLGRSLQFVFGWLYERHLGGFFSWFAAGVAALTLGSRLCSQRDHPHDPTATASSPAGGFALQALGFGALFLLAPAVILTLHPQKSEVVVSALVPGVVLIVAGVWAALAGGSPAAGFRNRFLATVGACAAVIALGYFGHCQRRPVDDPAVVANLRQVNALADYIFAHAQAAHLETPRVAVDNVTDALDAQVLRVICYERHRVWKNFDMKLPTGIAEPDAALVRQRVAESDFVFLAADNAPPGPFPYDRKLVSLRPELRQWCESHLRVAREFTLGGHPVVLYQRKEIPFP